MREKAARKHGVSSATVSRIVQAHRDRELIENIAPGTDTKGMSRATLGRLAGELLVREVERIEAEGDA